VTGFYAEQYAHPPGWRPIAGDMLWMRKNHATFDSHVAQVRPETPLPCQEIGLEACLRLLFGQRAALFDA
jgi:hypothetical protein